MIEVFPIDQHVANNLVFDPSDPLRCRPTADHLGKPIPRLVICMCQMQVRHRLASRSQVDFRDIECVTWPFSFADFNTLGHPVSLAGQLPCFLTAVAQVKIYAPC
jgi:hypothetical protein